MKKSIPRTFLFLPLLCLALGGLASLIPSPASAEENPCMSATITPGPYTIRDTGQGHEIGIKDFGRLLIPGKPSLPSKIFALAVPPGAEVTGVTFDKGEGIVLAGSYNVPPAPLPRVLGEEDSKVYENERKIYQDNYKSVYTSNNPYPDAVVEFVRFAGYRKYRLVDVRVTPFVYFPKSGQLIYHPQVKVYVHYNLKEEGSGDDALVDSLSRTEATARKIIANYDQIQSFYNGKKTLATQGLHDFVIITKSSLTIALTQLVTWEMSKGRTVSTVTIEWIDSNYGGVDLAQKMRNFLREKYPSGEWGIEDVLLVGHYDDVPMRRTAQDVGYGQPETDYYYAELSLPDNQSWDQDEDGNYGENSDPIDFYAEVNVGRIPWSEAPTVQSICQKSIAYEQNNDPTFKRNILLLGAYFWADTDNAVLMEAKVNQPWMSDWSMTRMYEQNSDYWSTYPCNYPLTHDNVMAVWPAGKYAFVNWAGHGSPTSCHILGLGAPSFIRSSDCPSLNDNYPAIIFADACSNSDTDYLNIGQAMLEQGGVGFLGATKVAYGMPGWNDPSDGSSQSMDYYFTTFVTSGDYSQGQAHQDALRTMYVNGLWYYVKYEMFEWGALWGNPDLKLDILPALSISFPEGLPGKTLPPGPQTKMVVRIQPGTEVYVPGTGFMHYRFDSGQPYVPEALTPLGGDLFEAVLPGTRPGDEPQFYFSAQGNGGTTVYSPYDAPVNVYSFDVCFVEEMMHDNFETHMGWTVENQDLSTGAWERVDPIGTSYYGEPAQPENDNPAGEGTRCYITQNGTPGGDVGEADVDGGPTRLISPTLDLSGGDGNISFYYWFFNDDGDDVLTVSLSRNNGVNWTSVRTLGHSPGWNQYSLRVSDFLNPSGEMKVRFSTSDNPNNSITEAGVDDFEVEFYNFTPTLWADNYSVQVGTVGRSTLLFQGDSSLAGKHYIILAGQHGHSPGMDLGDFHLPLNVDPTTLTVIKMTNTLVFQDFEGIVDEEGACTAVFNTVIPAPPFMEGVTLTFALVVLEGYRQPPIHHISNHVDVIFN